MSIDSEDTFETEAAAYVPDGATKPSRDELRERVPGWGVDLDPTDRPSNPRLDFRPDLTGAHWRFPDRQPENSPRERSIEHQFLTPVFGTAQPRRGLSGRLRKLAYARWSEGRNAHWLALVAADRVDVYESALSSLLHRQPDNVLAETGATTELTHGGLRSRFGQKRSDWKHHPMDPLVIAGPLVLAGWGAVVVGRRLHRQGSS